MSFILKRGHRSSHGLTDFQEQRLFNQVEAQSQAPSQHLIMKPVALTIICTVGYQIAIIDQAVCPTTAQGMVFCKKDTSNKKTAPHRDTLILRLGLADKGSSTTGFWSGDPSALNCLQASICSYNELPLGWLNLLY